MAHIFVKTWGCTANQDNGAIIAGLLLHHGHELVTTNEDADLIIYNTCTVKGTTENKIFSDIQHILQTSPEKKIIISGCMASAQTHLLHKIAPEASIISLQNLTTLPSTLDAILRGERVTLTTRHHEEKLGLPKTPRPDLVGIVQIAEGCADHCFFCITKLAKGHIFSFSQERIIEEVKKMLQHGYQTIHLTSQDNGAYGLDHNTTSRLAHLLQAILALDGNFKIRLGMTNPRHIIPIVHDLVPLFQHQKMMKFLHIPVQSGSDKVLQEMNRKHSAADFTALVRLFRQAIPDICIATDIICGYPTETEEDFQTTLTLLQTLQPEVVNISKFTPRPGTRAATLQQLPSQEIKRRTTLTTQIVHAYTSRVNAEKDDTVHHALLQR